MFEVVFRRTDDPDAPATDEDQVARNVSPFTVEPGKFTYRLVRGELEFPDYGQIFAHCRIDRGPWTVVPFTLLPAGLASPASDRTQRPPPTSSVAPVT